MRNLVSCATRFFTVLRCGTGVSPAREHGQDGRATGGATVNLFETHNRIANHVQSIAETVPPNAAGRVALPQRNSAL
ncbi:MAG: hypothetical protein ACE145_13040 [Terriglobia bacterium]